MESTLYLIDSNAVIDYLSNKFPASSMQFMNTIVDASPNISVITKIEVLGFNTSPEHYSLLKGFMNDMAIVGLSTAVIEQSIVLRKSYKIKLPDAIIAATALVYNFTIITRNEKDFESIAGLSLMNLHDK